MKTEPEQVDIELESFDAKPVMINHKRDIKSVPHVTIHIKTEEIPKLTNSISEVDIKIEEFLNQDSISQSLFK